MMFTQSRRYEDEETTGKEGIPFLPNIVDDHRTCKHVSGGHYRMVFVCLVVSSLLNILQLFVSLASYKQYFSASGLPSLYSPAQTVVRPAIRKFSPAFGVTGPEGIYVQPPSVEVDIAWTDLYDTTLSITHAEAAQLPNKTVPLSSAPDTGYLTGLTVFHDLHCLDSIRKALWVGESSTPTHSEGSSSAHSHPSSQGRGADPAVLAEYRAEMHNAAHLMHCINGLRESIMCHADVTPLSWQWADDENDVRVFSDVAHTCRDFDAIREWARVREYSDGIDKSGWKDGHPPEIGKCGYKDQGCGWE